MEDFFIKYFFQKRKEKRKKESSKTKTKKRGKQTKEIKVDLF